MKNTTASTNNANLKSLQLNKEGLSPTFNKNTYTYSLIVDESINSINVNAAAENSSAKVSIAGNTNLQTGLNKITITVTAADNKTTKNYVVNVTKTNNPELANANLETLAIEFQTLEPEFDNETTQYSVTVEKDVESLNILAVPEKQNANVNISGHENLQSGDNLIVVTVTAQDGITQKIFNINVHKKTADEELTEELIEETKENNKKLSTTNIVLISIISLVVISGIGYFIWKYVWEKRKLNKTR